MLFGAPSACWMMTTEVVTECRCRRAVQVSGKWRGVTATPEDDDVQAKPDAIWD